MPTVTTPLSDAALIGLLKLWINLIEQGEKEQRRIVEQMIFTNLKRTGGVL